MPEPQFALVEDDLPRTFRREREAREREAREREAREHELHDHEATGTARNFMPSPPLYGAGEAAAGTIDRIDIPFAHLAGFFVKAVFAAIPALVILTALLWLGGQALSLAFPALAKMQILIHFPK